MIEERCHFMEHTIGWGGDCYCCGVCGEIFMPIKNKQTIIYPNRREIVTQIAYDNSNGDVLKVTADGKKIDYLIVGSNVIVTLFVHRKPLTPITNVDNLK